jgi:hypothetical protein
MNINQGQGKIDFDDLVNKHMIEDKEVFVSYLTEIWFDLRSRSKDKLGVCKSTFFQVTFFFNLVLPFTRDYIR